MRDAKESTPRISCSERVEPDVPVRSRSSYIGMCPSGKLEAQPNPSKPLHAKQPPQRAAVSTSDMTRRFQRRTLPPTSRIVKNYSGFFFKEDSLVSKNPTRKMTVVPKTIVR